MGGQVRENITELAKSTFHVVINIFFCPSLLLDYIFVKRETIYILQQSQVHGQAHSSLYS